jgi:hypothetical protein
MTELWVQIPAHRVLVVDLATFTKGYESLDEKGAPYRGEESLQKPARLRRRRDGRLFKLARQFGQDVTFTAVTAAGIVLEEA